MWYVCILPYSHSGCSLSPKVRSIPSGKQKAKKKGVACVSTVSTGGDLSCDMPNQVVWKLRTRRSFYSIHDLSPSDASHPFFSGTPVLRLEIVCGLWKRTGRKK